jgi:hypothetical protein
VVISCIHGVKGRAKHTLADRPPEAMGPASGDVPMYRLPWLPLAVPFALLALLSLVAFLGVVTLAGALHLVGIKSGLGIAGRGSADDDSWHGMVGDAHPLDYVEGRQ